jgi:hypothetical protein
MRYGFTMIPKIDSEGAWNSQVIDALRGDTDRRLSAADRGGEPLSRLPLKRAATSRSSRSPSGYRRRLHF